MRNDEPQKKRAVPIVGNCITRRKAKRKEMKMKIRTKRTELFSASGYYWFCTVADGLCEYKTKKAAVSNAARAASLSGWVHVISPSGLYATEIECNKIGEQ